MHSTVTDAPPPPGPAERAFRAAVYAAIAFTGAVNLTRPPSPLGDALGEVLSLIWSVFMLSAAVPLVAAVTGRYRIEYAVMLLPLAALLIADLHIWVVAFLPGASPGIIPRAAMIAALIFALATRYAALNKLVRQGTMGRRKFTRGTR